MTKKEKNMVLIISVIVVVLVIFAIIASVLYFNTDMFKSKGDLFVKYIIENIENTNNMTNGENINEFNSKLGENKYTSNSNIKIKCTENVGEVSEDSKNSINDFNISINGKTDRSSNYDYKDIKMLFPGDSPIQLFENELPKILDVIKLPHHGSAKNISLEFIKNTKVKYYLLSTDGKRYIDHPGKAVIANIIKNTGNNTELIKNFEIKFLKGLGKLDAED